MAENHPVFHDSLDETPPPMASKNLVGHQSTLETLLAEFSAGKMHHATILAGPQGIGKATLAFQFAKAVFSNSGETNAGAQIEAGMHPSLLHLTRSWNEDTKKFRSEIVVADIQRANHFLSRTASGGGTRLILIDPADDMNRNAANALLKNLEEPPEKTHYFLITHNLGRLLPTIRSRCRVVVVPPLTDEQVVNVLAGNLGLTRQEAAELAGHAQGSVRQAMVMAKFGGMDIAAEFTAQMHNKLFGASKAQLLAAAVSGADNEPRYLLLVELIEKSLAKAARQKSIAGERLAADKISSVYHEVHNRLAIADAFNLDRKLEVYNLLRKVHPYLS